jgi:hypothetical protein
VRILGQRFEEASERLVHHRVIAHVPRERLQLLAGRKLAVHQQPGHLEKAALFGELFDRIAAVLQDAAVAVDEGDAAGAGSGVAEAGIQRDEAGGPTQFGDVEGFFALGALDKGQRQVFPVVMKSSRRRYDCRFKRHVLSSEGGQPSTAEPVPVPVRARRATFRACWTESQRQPRGLPGNRRKNTLGGRDQNVT